MKNGKVWPMLTLSGYAHAVCLLSCHLMDPTESVWGYHSKVTLRLLIKHLSSTQISTVETVIQPSRMQSNERSANEITDD